MVAALPAAGLDMPELLIYDVQDLHRILPLRVPRHWLSHLRAMKTAFCKLEECHGGVSGIR